MLNNKLLIQKAQWHAETKSGELLHFESCKGGYFSDKEEYGLRVVGKTFQDGTPTPEAPIPIQCVKQGTKIMICGKNLLTQGSTSGNNYSGGELTTPCDLYEGDIWYPMSGKVERKKHTIKFKLTPHQYTGIYEKRSNHVRFGYHLRSQGMPLIKHGRGANITCNIIPWIHDYVYPGRSIMAQGEHSNNMYISFYYRDLGEGLSVDTDNQVLTDAFVKYVNNKYNSGNPIIISYERNTPITEQYDPQPIFAPQGTVNVIQETVELAGEMSATMLVRR